MKTPAEKGTRRVPVAVPQHTFRPLLLVHPGAGIVPEPMQQAHSLFTQQQSQLPAVVPPPLLAPPFHPQRGLRVPPAPNPVLLPPQEPMISVKEHKHLLAQERSRNEELRAELLAEKQQEKNSLESEIKRLAKELEKEKTRSKSLENQKNRVKQALKKERANQELKDQHKKRKRTSKQAYAMKDDNDEDHDGSLPQKKRRATRTGISKDSKHDIKWMEMFEELKAFKAEHGHCDVPIASIGAGERWSRLAGWVSTQRTNHRFLRQGKYSSMTPERIRLLTAIGIKWDARPPGVVTLSWEERLGQLMAYKEKYGDCNVPQKYVDKDAPGLGNFVLSQRKDYREGTLSQERIEILEGLGFQWSLRDRGGTLSERMQKKRQQLHEEGGEAHL